VTLFNEFNTPSTWSRLKQQNQPQHANISDEPGLENAPDAAENYPLVIVDSMFP
jgi:hypothetical protein